jgi:hypothetical protein
MEIRYNGKSISLEDAIEDVIDEHFGGNEDLIMLFTMAMRDYVSRATQK